MTQMSIFVLIARAGVLFDGAFFPVSTLKVDCNLNVQEHLNTTLKRVICKVSAFSKINWAFQE